MDQPLRVAVIGVGDMGQQHLRGWQAAPGAAVVALADVNLPQAERAAAERGVPQAVADYRLAIDRPDVDVVSVCTPACFHPEVVLFAAQAGKQILCEKPISLTLADADRMIAAAREHGVTLGIGFMTRLAKGLPILRQLLEEDGIGRPALYRAHELARVRPKLMMHERGGNGGPIIDGCCHSFDLWSVLFGEPRRVMARGWVWGRGKPHLAPIREYAVDTAAMLIEFERGDTAAMTVSWGLPEAFETHGAHEEEILGPNGALRGDFRRELRFIDRDGKVTVYPDLSEPLYAKEIAEFARRLRAGEPPPASGEDGRRALRVSLAVLEAIESGGVVDLLE